MAVLALSGAEAADGALIWVGADRGDYFERVGLEPLLAFVRLGGATLERARLWQRLHEQATRDALTDLLNRQAIGASGPGAHVRGARPASLTVC